MNDMETKGRDSNFKCIICGKYVSYDRRKTIIKRTQCWDIFCEDAKEDLEVYHKRCYKLKGKE
jgi:uncharacterized protein YlaI